MESSTIQLDSAGFSDLQNQIINMKTPKGSSEDAAQKAPSEENSAPPSVKKMVFTKGDQKFEVDEDAEIEFTADKKPLKLSMRELRDRAAGDVAVKNRMHALAEEKKKVQSTLKEFVNLSKSDPLGALQFISEKAKEADSEFAFEAYLGKLADQADKVGKMNESERKAWELEKKLTKAEQDLSLKERKASAVLRKQEILESYPEIRDQQFSQMMDAVLENEELSAKIKNEEDAFGVVEELIQETLIQRDIINVIEEINPAYANDNDLIFNLSDQLRQNPDLDEEDIREIVRAVIKPAEKEKASRALSQRQRAAVPVSNQRYQGASDYDLLQQQLLERREKEKIKR